MSGWTESVHYECHGGCEFGGCRGHKGTVTYHGPSDMYEWETVSAGGMMERHHFDLNELRAFFDIIAPYFEEPR
jgi:hypothetical protein